MNEQSKRLKDKLLITDEQADAIIYAIRKHALSGDALMCLGIMHDYGYPWLDVFSDFFFGLPSLAEIARRESSEK